MQDSEAASVEEILESIKKVIARDNRAGAMQDRVRRERVQVFETAPEPADDEEADEVLDLGEASFVEQADREDEVAEDDRDGAEAADTSRDDEDDDDLGDPLTTAAVRGSMRENFAALAMLAEPGAHPQIVRSGETSLEGLTREMLRPMLAEWLDRNLPGMVEKLVRAEIARIAGKRG